MTEEELLEAAAASIAAADEQAACDLARAAVAAGLDPMKVIDQGYGRGMKVVGDRFERGRMFLPEVIIASGAMVAAIAILEEQLPEGERRSKTGIAVLGTIEGDVHDIGKGIVATLMRVYGFEVHDLGRDVPLALFVETARETGATIVGSSALMTTTMVGQKELEKLLQRAGIRERVKTMVGGAVVTQYWADKIGADAYAEDAQEAVAKAVELARSTGGADAGVGEGTVLG
jgi:corrinoid protein of di/trimethylamine methyltransferase